MMNSQMPERPDRGRSRWNRAYQVYGAIAVAASVAISIYGHKFIEGNEDARGVIVTVFSILAGFLIAVMTLLGDDSIRPGSWRIAEAQRSRIRTKLIRQKWLFYLYLLTLVVIFTTELFRSHYPILTEYLEQIYFGLAILAFLLSFRLPASLMEVQMERIEAIIGARRDRASKVDRS